MSNSYELSDFTLFREALTTAKNVGDKFDVENAMINGTGKFLFDENGAPIKRGGDEEREAVDLLWNAGRSGALLAQNYKPIFLADPDAGNNTVYFLNANGQFEKKQIGEYDGDANRRLIESMIKPVTPAPIPPKKRNLFEIILGWFGYKPDREERYERTQRIRRAEQLQGLARMGVAPHEAEKDALADVWELTPEQKDAYIKTGKSKEQQELEARNDTKKKNEKIEQLAELDESMVRAVKDRVENREKIRSLFLEGNGGKTPENFKGSFDQLMGNFSLVKNAKLAEALAQRSPEEVALLINNACQVGNSDMNEMMRQIDRDLGKLEKNAPVGQQGQLKKTFEERLTERLAQVDRIRDGAGEFAHHLMELSRTDPKLRTLPLIVSNMEPDDAANLYTSFRLDKKMFDQTVNRDMVTLQTKDHHLNLNERNQAGKYTVTAGTANPYVENLKTIDAIKLPN